MQDRSHAAAIVRILERERRNGMPRMSRRNRNQVLRSNWTNRNQEGEVAMTSVSIDPESVKPLIDDEKEPLDVKWDALRPQARIPLEEARRAGRPAPPLAAAVDTAMDALGGVIDAATGEDGSEATEPAVDTDETPDEAPVQPVAKYGYKKDGTPRKRPVPTAAIAAKKAAKEAQATGDDADAEMRGPRLRAGTPRAAFTPDEALPGPAAPRPASLDPVQAAYDDLADQAEELRERLTRIETAMAGLRPLL